MYPGAPVPRPRPFGATAAYAPEGVRGRVIVNVRLRAPFADCEYR
jgi:hypothetical protein